MASFRLECVLRVLGSVNILLAKRFKEIVTRKFNAISFQLNNLMLKFSISATSSFVQMFVLISHSKRVNLYIVKFVMVIIVYYLFIDNISNYWYENNGTFSWKKLKSRLLNNSCKTLMH